MYALAALLITGGAVSAFLVSGYYNIGADQPHSRLTFWALETLRNNSVDKRSKTIQVPPLDSSDLLIAGGQDYNEMCAGCHMRPGRRQTDLSQGLYPSPPDLTLPPQAPGAIEGNSATVLRARNRFWIIKHGIKASGMPAWGLTHDDNRIWAMVAFLEQLPALTLEQYEIITARKRAVVGHH
tara:strand:+ start:46161 stop:46706 length:546 start_codon:yes stop_codon:yes gene_type:complete